jgi:uncharacterized protein VirK/YbjX
MSSNGMTGDEIHCDKKGPCDIDKLAPGESRPAKLHDAQIGSATVAGTKAWLSHVGSSIKDHVKLTLGAILFPLQSLRWRRFLVQHPALSTLAQQYPRMRHKIYRPYLSRHLDCAGRVDVLIDHYNAIFNAGLGQLICQAALRPVTMAKFSGKCGDAFELQLLAINAGHREGELVLQLVHQGVCVYSATFLLLKREGQACIKLGALQGLRAPDANSVIKRVTRELHGCRPKNLMVTLVRSIGMHLGCATLLLVSNANRVAINDRRSRRISSNYDQTWQELAATELSDGNFALACALDVEKQLDLIASNKRAETKRRSALLLSIHDIVTHNLSHWKQPQLQPELPPNFASDALAHVPYATTTVATTGF